MWSRFNAVNENGTLDSTLYPPSATRDSCYGNTELFNGLENVVPEFDVGNLTAGTAYSLTFYASRLGVADNRETAYTVSGETIVTVHLNPANNLTAIVTATPIRPDASGEAGVSFAPGPSNNNGNHFTYLGLLRITAAVAPRFDPPLLESGELWLEWSGAGHLQWSPNVSGPWTPVSPAVTPPYAEPVDATGERYFRLSPVGE